MISPFVLHISVLQGWGKEVVGCGTIKTVLKNVFVICVVLACSSKKTKTRISMTASAKTSKGCSGHQLKPNASFMRPAREQQSLSIIGTVTFLRIFKFLYQCTLF